MPPLDAVLASVLGCPRCKGPLTVYEDARRTEVRCPRCHCAWPVEDGIPRLVPARKSKAPPEPGD